MTENQIREQFKNKYTGVANASAFIVVYPPKPKSNQKPNHTPEYGC